VLATTAPRNIPVVPTTTQSNALATGAAQTSATTTPSAQAILNGSGAAVAPSTDLTVGGFDVTQNWMWLAGGAAALILLLAMSGRSK
jgi:hypothetical protein